MKSSHVFLKVEQLDQAVQEYREKGVAVEYGRDLRFRIASPAAPDVPFLMTYFPVDPKPVDFIHPRTAGAERRIRDRG